ncbi:NADPH:quinone oxidoreductase family protein [Alteriqipengyuania lutimaris]|uniref:NADPH:quinone oxidoreductase family protein n=1 Tax=Alteriqipengyuania lutimaris TaxID=1538146 RepID=A0A395LN67_9SPHN|nr:NADPH:quinone oxidoreductase family protein [Alteriqipengyuania lutimaris]MBB3032694.1 NADPH:quinone reductase-like Zn-dependent oxidoreductase [Alteriqipengyuania lutimaris]RDS78195.1 NADPH:quinone oxidoreductase family protein [Alteriqipengyuania lutimaris]
MKAVLTKEVGGPETLVVEQIDSPAPGKGEVLVDVAACAINFPDTLMIRDLYQFKPERPYSPGGEISGTITAVGEGVDGWKVGDRVLSGIGSGGLREQVAVEAGRLFKVPEGVNLVDASALLMTYGTMIHALKDRGDIKPGETVLVLGAAGGVGLASIELAKAYGAKVVAAVSSDDKAKAAVEAGADETVVYPRAPFDKEQSKALAGDFKNAVGPNGADIVVDIVGGDYSEPALRSIAWEGRFLVIGFPAGIAKMPLNLTLLKSCDIRGVFWGAFAARDPKANAQNIADLFEFWKDGKIAPRISETFSLDEAHTAIQKLENREAVGKLVVVMDS